MLQAPRPKTHTDTDEATRGPGPGPGPGGPRVKPWRLGSARQSAEAEPRRSSVSCPSSLWPRARRAGHGRHRRSCAVCLHERRQRADHDLWENSQTATTALAGRARGAFLVVCGRMASKRARKCCPRPAPARLSAPPQACSSETVTIRGRERCSCK